MVWRYNPNRDEIYDLQILRGKAIGQMSFWNGSVWVHTETSEMFWDDVNKRVRIGEVVVSGQNINLSEPSLTYTGEVLTRIDYPDGKYKEFSYNVDETLASIDYNNEYTKTFTYTDGKLTEITTT